MATIKKIGALVIGGLFMGGVAEGQALRGNPEVTPEDCLGRQETITDFDFENSFITENNLHKGGVLKYEAITKIDDRDVDLVVSIVPGTTYENIGVNRHGVETHRLNGKQGKFGRINLQTVQGDTTSGEANLRFCLYDTLTDELKTVDSFHFGVYDIDERNDPTDTLKEKLVIDVSTVENYILYPDIDGSEVKLFCEDSAASPPCEEGERTEFRSSTRGGAGDNPNSLDSLTEQQKKRSVVFAFKDTSCWEFTYNHYCPVELIPEARGRCQWYGGGNFMFSGRAQQVVDGGQCMTPPPTVSPPVRGVVSASVDSEDTPISVGECEEEKANGGNDSFLQTCPGDIELVKQVGGKDFPALDEAVKFISKDRATVTLQLNQAWQSSCSSTIDSIYYEYRDGLYNAKCYGRQDVRGGMTYVEEVTIQCNAFNPKGTLEICIVDAVGKGFLGSEDNGIIPECCHSEEPDTSPVVCYTLEINCDSSECRELDESVPKSEPTTSPESEPTTSPTYGPTSSPTQCSDAPHPPYTSFPKEFPDCKFEIRRQEQFNKYGMEAGKSELANLYKDNWNVEYRPSDGNYKREVHLPNNVRSDSLFWANVKSTYDVEVYANDGGTRGGYDKLLKRNQNYMMMYYRGFGWVNETIWMLENLPKWPRQASDNAYVVDTQDEIDTIKDEEGTSGLFDLYNEYSEIKIYNENGQLGENYYLPDNVPQDSLFWIEVMSNEAVTVHFNGSTSTTSGLSNQSRILSSPKTDWILLYDETYGWLTQSKWRDINDNYNE